MLAFFDDAVERIELVETMKEEIKDYFNQLAMTAQEMRKDNNPLNDAEIISGRYKQDILEIIEKYFPSPNER